MLECENAFNTGGVTKQQLDQAKLALTNHLQLKQANIVSVILE
jgi:hypothetical protein